MDNRILDVQINNTDIEKINFPYSCSSNDSAIQENGVIRKSLVNYSFSPEKQFSLIESSFKNYLQDRTDTGVISKMIDKLSEDIVEEKVNSMTFKFLDKNSSDMHTAVSNNLIPGGIFAEDYANLGENSEDMITFELEKKLKKLENWIDFLIKSHLLDMIGKESRSYVLQSIEKISSILKIRELQREMRKNPGSKNFSKSAFDKFFSLFLNQFDYENKASMLNGEMELEESGNNLTEHKNPNKFFFFVSKHYKIIPKIVKFIIGGNIPEEEQYLYFDISSKLFNKILSEVQQVRKIYMPKLKISTLSQNWWLHESEITYGNSGLVAFFNIFSQKIASLTQNEDSKLDLKIQLNTLAEFLLKELNQDFRAKRLINEIDSNQFLDRNYNSFISSSMGVLLTNKQNEEVLKLAEEIISYEYICQLFVDYEYEVPIKKFVKKWGNEFLTFFIRYSCSFLKKLSLRRGHDQEAKFYDLNQNEVNISFNFNFRELFIS